MGGLALVQGAVLGTDVFEARGMDLAHGFLRVHFLTRLDGDSRRTREDKERGFDGAPPGISGLETALGLAMTELVHRKVLTLAQLADKMSASPARIVGLEKKGWVKEGFDADITIVDLEENWRVEVEGFVSKGKNSPFFGKDLKGRVQTTVCGGKVVYEK